MATHERAYQFTAKSEGGKDSNPHDLTLLCLIDAEKLALGGRYETYQNENGETKKRVVGKIVHTNKGITFPTYKLVCKKCFGFAPNFDHFLSITNAEVEKIFVDEYFHAIRGEFINSEKVAIAVSDFCFNAGAHRAVKILQSVLNLHYGKELVIDGVIGWKTINGTNEVDADSLFKFYNEDRKRYYVNLANYQTSQKGNLTGWLNRINALSKFVEKNGIS